MSPSRSVRDRSPPLDEVDQVDETQPLLASSKPKVTPLPKTQLALLFFIRATDPICYNVIFPFINQMLLDVGGVDDPTVVGYRAGLVESLFSLAQLLTIFHWGALSDRIGRKPVLLLGCIGSSLSSLVFGFSNSFVMIVIARCLNGAMNGNIAVLKCALAEITDSTNQARAVSLFPICLNGGIIIASFLGGQLANTRGTALAGMFPIFETFPYLLPMLLASLFPMISGLCALFFLKETLSTKIRKVDEEDVVEDEGVVRRKDVDGPTKASSSELVTKHIGLLIFTFAVQSFVGISMNALLPLFCFTPIESGGLGMDSESIGYVISQRSVTVLLLQVFGFPWLAKKLGLVRLHRWAMVLWVATFAIMPIINLAARSGPNWLVWSELYAFMVIGALAGVCSVCNLLMTNNAAPRPELLGTLNGFSQMTSSVVGVVGPGSANSLFAVSIEKHLLGGHLIWVVFGGVAAIGAAAAYLIEDEKEPGEEQ
ncbi:hypothetical protein JCM24511_04025 [Saitozyma sp. JCM 24511]|nr:hypothetical protein JCM24511_04025 [Saitozyma sp. JCM 24511]